MRTTRYWQQGRWGVVLETGEVGKLGITAKHTEQHSAVIPAKHPDAKINPSAFGGCVVV